MRATRTRITMLAVPVVVGLLAGACGGGTRELPLDPDDGLEGPLPTAPNGSPRNGADLGAGDPFSGSVDVNDLIRRINALSQETDLCTLLTGEAMADVTGADIDLTGLASNPSGFGQLFAALDTLYGHMATIGPPELVGALSTLQRVWGGLADIDIRSPDAESQAAELLASADTQAANDALGTWVATNCTRG